MPIQPEPLDSDPILEQAYDWLAKMHSGEFTEAQHSQLSRWRNADSTNEQAWQHAQRLWQSLGSLKSQSAMIPGSQPLLPECRSAKRRWWQSASSWAVACSLMLMVTLWAYYPPVLWQADYVTGKGEQQTFTLADNSTVTLNTDSAIRIDFNGRERRIELLQGEAYFTVAKAQLPFIVDADGTEVTAVGTAFSVYLRANAVRVELLEGKVKLQAASQVAIKPLTAGQTAQIGNGSISVENSSTSDNLALWREGYLKLDGLPLSEAIAQINRYRPGRIILLNSKLNQHRVSGLFRLNAMDQALTNLQTVVPQLHVTDITAFLTVLH